MLTTILALVIPFALLLVLAVSKTDSIQVGLVIARV
jgi:hypothetical protein